MGITIDGQGPFEKLGVDASVFREALNQKGGTLALMADTQGMDPRQQRHIEWQ